MHSALLLSLAGAIAPAVAETVHGVVIFSRHGDRTSKHYSGYQLTSLGAQQNYQVGSLYRSLYLESNSSKQILGISEDKYVPAQIYASAPDQLVLLNTATAFLQGLYPPLDTTNPQIASSTLNNGTNYANPLNGYQYVVLHSEDTNSPDTVWIKGDDGCPAVNEAAEAFEDSTEFQSRVMSTRSFYDGFWGVLKGVYDYRFENLSYFKAYDIFDLINVASIHNTSVTQNVTADQLFQLRTLADSAEFGSNYDASQPARSIGGQTLGGALFAQLNQTVATKGKQKFALLAGSYDTFLAFFGITNLIAASSDFYGLPGYAATMGFELFTKDNMTSFPSDTSALNVRFLFRNGSDLGTPIQNFPLFGRSEIDMSWADFSSEMQKRMITTVKGWCNACGKTDSFCLQYASTSSSSTSTGSQPAATGGSKSGISNAVAGVIGAMVTLGVAALAALAFVLLRRKSAKPTPAATEEVGHRADKASVGSSSGSA